MKINKETYNHIKAAYQKIIDQNGIEKVLQYKNDILNGEKGNDKNKLYRWNLMWGTGIYKEDSIRDYLNSNNINDDHMDTALKAIVKELCI